MTLDEIRTLLRLRDAPSQDCGEVNALLDEHIGHVAQRIRELRALEKDLKALRARCASPHADRRVRHPERTRQRGRAGHLGIATPAHPRRALSRWPALQSTRPEPTGTRSHDGTANHHVLAQRPVTAGCRRGPDGCRAVRRRHAAGQAAPRRRQPLDAGCAALPRLRHRLGAVAHRPPRTQGQAAATRSALAGRRRARRWRGRTGAADVRAVAHAGVRRVAAAERRRRVHRVAGMVCVPRELRPPHRHRHARHRGRRRGAELAGRGPLRRGLAGTGGAGCLPGLGRRQQPHPQGGAERRHLDRSGQGPGRRRGESAAGAGRRQRAAGRAGACRRAGAGLRGLRRQPRAVRRRPAAPGHGPHRRVLLGRTVLRCGAGRGRVGRADHRALADRRRADGLGRLAAPERAARARAHARGRRARA